MFCLVKTRADEVYVGDLKQLSGAQVVLRQARKMMNWQTGAPNLQYIASMGFVWPSACKVTVPVDMVALLDAETILSVTEQAQAEIEQLPRQCHQAFVFAG